MESANSTAFACQLDALDADERTRHHNVMAQLHKAVQAVQDLPDGYALRFAGAAYSLVAEFVARERICCPFFHFVLDVAPGDGPTWLHIKGQPGVKDFIQNEFQFPLPPSTSTKPLPS